MSEILKIYRVLDKFPRIGEDGVRERLRDECGLDESQAELWVRLLRCRSLSEVRDFLSHAPP